MLQIYNKTDFCLSRIHGPNKFFGFICSLGNRAIFRKIHFFFFFWTILLRPALSNVNVRCRISLSLECGILKRKKVQIRFFKMFSRPQIPGDLIMYRTHSCIHCSPLLSAIITIISFVCLSSKYDKLGGTVGLSYTNFGISKLLYARLKNTIKLECIYITVSSTLLILHTLIFFFFMFTPFLLQSFPASLQPWALI